MKKTNYICAIYTKNHLVDGTFFGFETWEEAEEFKKSIEEDLMGDEICSVFCRSRFISLFNISKADPTKILKSFDEDLNSET